MTELAPGPAESHRISGGVIPGLADCPAFTLRMHEPTQIPVLIAVPHAGRAYSDALVARMRNPGITCLRLEDRLADRLGEEIARRTGAALLVAHAPRAAIDLNRDIHEIDCEMVEGGWRSGDAQIERSPRVVAGLGLVPRRLGGVGEIWKGRMPESYLRQLVAGVHEPYHSAVSSALEAIFARWGAALLIDLHSMPPLTPGPTGRRTEIVVGDRFGASCSGALIAATFDNLAGQNMLAAYNRPYAGGYVLDRHGSPADGIHALQIEVCRSLYLDSTQHTLSEGMDAVTSALADLVRTLARELIALPRGGVTGNAAWGLAAE